MRPRWGIATIAAAALLAAAIPSAGARTADAPAALTPEQLAALHRVAAWDVDFRFTLSGQGNGASTLTYTFLGSQVTADSVSSYSVAHAYESHFTVTTNGSDCSLLDRIGCPVDLALPLRISFADQHTEQTTTRFSDQCVQSDFTIGPGTTSDVLTESANGSVTNLDINPADLTGAFFIDYRTSTPYVVGSLGYTAELRGNRRQEQVNCQLPPDRQPGPVIGDYNAFAQVLTADRVDAMPISVVDGSFQASGSYTTETSGCGPIACGALFTSATEKRTYDWTIREHLDRNPRIDAAVIEQPDIPSGEMRPVPPTGTFDGNPVQLAVTVTNPRPTPQGVRVDVTDTDTGLPASVTGDGTATIPAGATRTITLGWDSTGKAWLPDRTPQPPHRFTFELVNDADSQQWDTADRALIVLPRPIVLVHGWNSSAATWSGLRTYMSSRYPYWKTFAVDTMNTGNLLSPLTPSNTIVQNAQAVDAFVRSVRSQTEAQHVDLLVHSMGGLISRRYVQDDMPSDASDGRPVVSHLVMLGTPNLGSPCAYLIPWPQPSSFELRPDSVTAFNIQVTNRRGVPFSILAGTPVPSTCGLAGPGDGVVDLGSALQGGAIGDFGVDPLLLHTSMPSSISAFEDFAKPRLAGDAAAATAPAPRRRLARRRTHASTQAVEPQLLATDGIPLAAGETRSIDVEVGDARAIGGILLASGDVSAELRRPNGSTAATIAAGVVDPAQPFRSFADISSPGAGRWTLRIANTGPAALSAAFSIWETGESSAIRVEAADEHDGRARVTAGVLKGPASVRGEQVAATFRAVDGTTATATLVDNGTNGDAKANDGEYTAVQALPAGDFMLTVRATGRVTRTTFVRLQMSAAGSPGPPPVCRNDERPPVVPPGRSDCPPGRRGDERSDRRPD